MIEMTLGMGAETEQRQEQRVSPRLIQANEVLQLSSDELQQLIAREIEENPALEVTEPALCDACGGELAGSICPRCLSRQKVEQTDADAWDEHYSGARDLSLGGEDDDTDPLSRIAAEATLEERLLMQLFSFLPERDHPLAEFLVGSLDENGYLRVDVQDVAGQFDMSLKQVEDGITHLQTLDPVGVGARNLRECLLIQLDYLEQEEGLSHPVARQIVELGLLDELAAHRYRLLSAALGCRTSQIADAARFISDELNPHPAKSEWESAPGVQRSRTVRLLPDVLIVREAGGYRAEVVESDRFALRIAPVYRDIAREIERNPAQYSVDEAQHVKEYVSRARTFLENIHQRRETIRKIAECVIREQQAFLDEGAAALKPLTRARVAQIVGFHESTVSRATASKYAMLPDRRVIPMADFFTPSLAPKEVMQHILREEPHLTDAEIAVRLRRKGVVIARRTVAKYRAQLGILPSTKRSA
jgi:RNA polymerase sigma-54 factor